VVSRPVSAEERPLTENFVGSIFTLAGAPAWVCAALALAYFGLITVLACTATFARSPARRRAALVVLQLLWVRRSERSRSETPDSL
jgi:hypothetical protein